LGKEDGPDRDKITVGKCWDEASIAGCTAALGCDGQSGWFGREMPQQIVYANLKAQSLNRRPIKRIISIKILILKNIY
jgi:hypothetical protein